MLIHILGIVCLSLLILLEIYSAISCSKSDAHKKYLKGHIVAIIFAVGAIACHLLLLN